MGYDELGHISLQEGVTFSTKPCQIVFTDRLDQATYKELLASLKHLEAARLDFKLIDLCAICKLQI